MSSRSAVLSFFSTVSQLHVLGIAARQAAVDTAMQAPATAKLQLPILTVGLPHSGS